MDHLRNELVIRFQPGALRQCLQASRVAAHLRMEPASGLLTAQTAGCCCPSAE